jgi:hypothetical protein
VTKEQLLGTLDTLLVANTDSNATLVNLYETIEHLFIHLDVLSEDVEYLRGKVSRLQGTVLHLTRVRKAAEELLEEYDEGSEGAQRGKAEKLRERLSAPEPVVPREWETTAAPWRGPWGQSSVAIERTEGVEEVSAPAFPSSPGFYREKSHKKGDDS